MPATDELILPLLTSLSSTMGEMRAGVAGVTEKLDDFVLEVRRERADRDTRLVALERERDERAGVEKARIAETTKLRTYVGPAIGGAAGALVSALLAVAALLFHSTTPGAHP